MIKLAKVFTMILLTVGMSISSQEQVTVTGPTCVVSGTSYEYTIVAAWDSVSTMNVCIKGGMIADPADSVNCTPTGAPVAQVLVTWNGSDSGSLIVTSSLGGATITVAVCTPLTPGTIDSASMVQTVGYDSVPAIIICSVDVGGACAPAYSYQWQQSVDMVEWSDIAGDTLQNLSIVSGLVQSTYYRRKVTETISGTIGYSNAAVVFVTGPTAADTRTETPGNSIAKQKWLEHKESYKPQLLKDFKPGFII